MLLAGTMLSGRSEARCHVLLLCLYMTEIGVIAVGVGEFRLDRQVCGRGGAGLDHIPPGWDSHQGRDVGRQDLTTVPSRQVTSVWTLRRKANEKGSNDF